MSLSKKIISLLIFIAFAFGASAWGSLVTSLSKEPWYSTIIKPTFNPPDWGFCPSMDNLVFSNVLCNLVNLD